MKSTKSVIFLSMLTFLTSLFLSGCYTQLALVEDEPDSIVDPQPTVINQTSMVVYVNEPVYYSQPAFVPSSLPIVVSSSPVPQTQSQTGTRESGYQRTVSSDQTRSSISPASTRSQEVQMPRSDSSERTSGVRRSGR